MIVAPYIIAFLAALILGYIVRLVYIHFGFVDDPQNLSHVKVVHQYPVPRGGGLVVGISLILVVVCFLPLTKPVWGITLGLLILIAQGIVDDIYDISPYLRLILGVMAALLVVGSGIGIAYITNPFGSGVVHLNQPQIVFELFGKIRSIWVIADIFALVWIVWCMNMLNWSKGVDGQLPGIVVIAAMVVGLLSLRFGSDINQYPVTILSFGLSGAYLGLLFWNIYPQRMMPGYGGGSIAGYALAVLSILSGAKLATLLIVLCIPMLDAMYVILQRVFRGRSPFWGDRSHLHHALMDIGFGKRRIAAFYWITTIIFGIIALQLNHSQKVFTIILISLVIVGVLVWIRSLIYFSRPRGRDSG